MQFHLIVKYILRQGMSFIQSHPKIGQFVVDIIQRLGLFTVVRDLYSRLKGTPNRSRKIRSGVVVSTDLSPRARQIYADLKVAIKHRQGENG